MELKNTQKFQTSSLFEWHTWKMQLRVLMSPETTQLILSTYKVRGTSLPKAAIPYILHQARVVPLAFNSTPHIKKKQD